MGHFEVAESASTLRMNDALRDSFASEMGQLIDQVYVLQEDRPTSSNGQSSRSLASRRAASESRDSRTVL